jgi:hypothetical protein
MKKTNSAVSLFSFRETTYLKRSIMDTSYIALSSTAQVLSAHGVGDLLSSLADVGLTPLDLDAFDQVSGGIAPAVVAGIAAATAVTFAAGAVFGAAVAVVVMSSGDDGGDKGPVIAPGT